MGLDDEDISQVLSLPLKDFEQGVRFLFCFVFFFFCALPE